MHELTNIAGEAGHFLQLRKMARVLLRYNNILQVGGRGKKVETQNVLLDVDQEATRAGKLAHTFWRHCEMMQCC